MKSATIILAIILIIIYASLFYKRTVVPDTQPVVTEKGWIVKSVDTVKYSRDLAREKSRSLEFTSVIDRQVRDIADIGASHVAIGTPYDEEFIPFMTAWVKAARNNGLKVWFRGNFSGWEGWFDYETIDREKHKEKLAGFIKNNPNLFEDGDLFTSCTECENGGPGDPRQTGDVDGHRQFLIEESIIAREAFRSINKNIASNLYPMNGDVAKIIMDPQTTTLLGGLVVVDHYVLTPEKLDSDLRNLAFLSKGKVVLGEFGVPIPDIHGQITEDEQAEWLDFAMKLLDQNENIAGVNYWTNKGGSTQIWKDDGSITKAGLILRKYFRP